MGHTVVDGYLFKMKREPRNVLQQWTKRYFTVEDFCLKWRSSPEKSESGSIPLSMVSGVRDFECGSKGTYRCGHCAFPLPPAMSRRLSKFACCYVHSFIVESEPRTLFLRAESNTDKRKWMRALAMQIDLVKGGTGQGVVSRGEGTSMQRKAKMDKSIVTEIDKNLVLLNEIERIQKDKEVVRIGELRHDKNSRAARRSPEPSYTEITLDDHDISLESF